MALLDILIHPDPRLKKPSAPVAAVTPALRALAADMFQTMYAAPGIGLAAPQVGMMQRLIVVDCIKDKDAAPRPIAMLNPEVTWSSDERSIYDEGCLSIPEQYGEVERPAAVEVRWHDLDMVAHSERFDGLWATCVQHEIDHLEGKLFIDYLRPLRRQLITRKMVKLKRERMRA